MNPDSHNLCKRIVRAYQQGEGTVRELGDRFDVSFGLASCSSFARGSARRMP